MRLTILSYKMADAHKLFCASAIIQSILNLQMENDTGLNSVLF
jgi:hypothetical protein